LKGCATDIDDWFFNFSSMNPKEAPFVESVLNQNERSLYTQSWVHETEKNPSFPSAEEDSSISKPGFK